MNKQALVFALGWALQCMAVQAAEPIIQPADLPKPDAVQAAPRAKASKPDRRATAATARRTGIEQGKVREAIEPEDRTGMTRREKTAPRSGVEPQDRPRRIVQPQDKPAYAVEPQDRPATIIDPEEAPRQLLGPNNRPGYSKATSTSNSSIESGSVGAPNLTVGDAAASTRGRWRALVQEFALGLVGNCIAQFASPDRADLHSEDPDIRNAAPAVPGGSCIALPMARGER